MDWSPLDVDPPRSVKEPVSRILPRPTGPKNCALHETRAARSFKDSRRDQTHLRGKEWELQSTCTARHPTRWVPLECSMVPGNNHLRTVPGDRADAAVVLSFPSSHLELGFLDVVGFHSQSRYLYTLFEYYRLCGLATYPRYSKAINYRWLTQHFSPVCGCTVQPDNLGTCTLQMQMQMQSQLHQRTRSTERGVHNLCGPGDRTPLHAPDSRLCLSSQRTKDGTITLQY